MTAEHPRPQRVLIVDDDARLVFVMQEVLGDAGYETKVAADTRRSSGCRPSRRT